MTNFFETPGDTGLTQSDSIELYYSRTFADTGLSQTDSIQLYYSRRLSDTITTTATLARILLIKRDLVVTATIAPVFIRAAMKTVNAIVTHTLPSIGIHRYGASSISEIEPRNKWSMEVDYSGWTMDVKRRWSIDIKEK